MFAGTGETNIGAHCGNNEVEATGSATKGAALGEMRCVVT